MTATPIRVLPSGDAIEDAGTHPIPRRLLAAWAALFFNVLTYPGPALIPIPGPVGQAMAQGSLVLALFLALFANPRMVVRHSSFLILITVLAVSTLVPSIHNEFVLGSSYRALRFIVFVLVLWLLSPWCGRRDMVLLRCHRLVLWVLLASVMLGAAIAPARAFAFEGRLAGVLWPIPPTQVAHYGAILFGTSAVLWVCRVISGRHALVCVLLTGGVMVATHTRTAMGGLIAGLVVAGASLYLSRVRARRAAVLGAVAVVGIVTVFAGDIVTWLLRGQTTEEASQLTGRAEVWSLVSEYPRPWAEAVFGSGMSNLSFKGLSVDSNWVATYLDQGWLGVALHVVILVLLLMMAAVKEAGPHRAVGLFLVVYGTVASVTESGLLIPSAYLLDLAVAAALLLPPASER